MKDFPRLQAIEAHKEARKRLIVDRFVDDGSTPTATRITKAEFEQNYPLSDFEVYTVGAVNAFREELKKADDYTDDVFKEAVKDLQAFMVQDGSKNYITFARKKSAEEKK